MPQLHTKWGARSAPDQASDNGVVPALAEIEPGHFAAVSSPNGRGPGTT